MAKAIGEVKTEAGKVVKGNFKPLREVAKDVGVHYSTILNWVKKGKVAVNKYKNHKGHWVFREEDIPKFKDYIHSVRLEP